MTAYTRTTIECDHFDGRYCVKEYEPPMDYTGKRTASALRRLAAKDGWTYVRSDIARFADEDFCPEHKPAGAS
jgi:hypothetical protein